MKKLLDNFRSLPDKTKKLIGLGITLALVVALPLFIWAIVTQRFELRKKAEVIPKTYFAEDFQIVDISLRA